MAALEFLTGELSGQQVSLSQSRAVIGRDPQCDIVLSMASVSRRHAEITLVDGQYFIEDLRSRNKTLVNGRAIETPLLLNDGDELKICDMAIAFRDESAAAGDTAVGLLRQAGPEPPFQMVDDSLVNGPLRSSTILWKIDVGDKDRPRQSANSDFKLKVLMQIAQNLSRATAMEEILAKLLDSLFNIFAQADRGFIVLCTPDGRLVPRAFKHRSPGQETNARISRTIINQVVKNKQAVLSADAATDARFQLSQSINDFRIRSLLCAPLVTSEGQVLGVIQIDSLDRRSRFGNDDLELLASVAVQAAFAIDNTQLHERQMKQQAMQRDLELAHKVQRGLLPTSKPILPGYQFFDFYEAANGVGGDFFDYVSLRDGRVAVVLADVSGKGMSAALIMSRLSADVRYSLSNEPSPAKALEQINASFCAAGWDDRFATMILALVDVEQHRVTIVNAGHIPPFIQNAAGVVCSAPTASTELPLGVADNITYTSTDIRLGPGETVILFTDGISEALNSANELYTMERLKECLATPSESPAALGKSVLADVNRHSGGRSQSDDMCLVAFGRNRVATAV